MNPYRQPQRHVHPQAHHNRVTAPAPTPEQTRLLEELCREQQVTVAQPRTQAQAAAAIRALLRRQLKQERNT